MLSFHYTGRLLKQPMLEVVGKKTNVKEHDSYSLVQHAVLAG